MRALLLSFRSSSSSSASDFSAEINCGGFCMRWTMEFIYLLIILSYGFLEFVSRCSGFVSYFVMRSFDRCAEHTTDLSIEISE